MYIYVYIYIYKLEIVSSIHGLQNLNQQKEIMALKKELQ
jgi:hypothetical protein